MTESEKLRTQLTHCPLGSVDCLACDALRTRLRLLSAPKIDLDSLPKTVPVEHQAKSFGVLWPVQQGGGL